MRPINTEPTSSQYTKIADFVKHHVQPFIVNFFMMVSLVVGVLIALCLLIVGPLFLGIYSLWERRRTLFTPPALENPEIEYYQYRPKQTRFQQVLSAFKWLFNIMILPFYLYGLGVKMLVSLPIYPTTILYSTTGISAIVRFFLKIIDPETYAELEAMPDERRYEHEALGTMDKFDIQQCFIEMPNHVRLHTCAYTPKNVIGDLKNIPHIIYFQGNAARYENALTEMQADAFKLGATVIGFHHSNFGRSGLLSAEGKLRTITPTSQTQLVQEGVAQVQRLLDKGVISDHIVLYGHSLGGGIATLVAWHFHQQGMTIKIYNDRSFSSISKQATEMILPLSPEPSTTLQKMANILKQVGSFFIKSIIKLTDWDLSSGSVIHKLAAWDYCVIRDTTKNRDHQVVKQTNDNVIEYEASLHRAPEVRAARKNEKQNASTEERSRIQARHKVRCTILSPNPHMESLCFFKNRNGITPKEQFYNFARSNNN